jgi:GTP-binding protein Era
MVNKQCGYVAIVGRPNVGKSTLINKLVGTKVCITSRRPQTTRHRLLGIKTTESAQIIYVDTPGLHRGCKKELNQYMNRAAQGAMQDVDVIVFIVDKCRWTAEEDWILEQIRAANRPTILVINKIDQLAGRDQLLPYLPVVQQRYDFVSIVPISARSGSNCVHFEKEITKHLPEQEFYYFEDKQVSDRSRDFMASELIREQLMTALGDELPYENTVTVQTFSEKPNIIEINAIIWVERTSQKGIVVGTGGIRLREVGRGARLEMEQLFGKKVMLRVWVKVKSGWTDNVQTLADLGYTE